MNEHVQPVHRAVVGKGIAHDSAKKHVSGQAVYIDDMADMPGTLHAALILSPVAKGTLNGVDASEAAAMDSVVAIVTAGDIPGHNDIAPILSGEPMFADGALDYIGMPVGAVAAETFEQAVRAAHAVQFDLTEETPVLDIEEAHARGDHVIAPQRLASGDVDAALEKADRIVEGRLEIGGQDHFYLETQIAYAIPGEDGDMTVHSSTQHPTEVQHHVAHVLGGFANAVDVQVRRMGGGFGGKESQATIIACAAALLARKTGRPVRMRLKRSADMSATGKRHDMVSKWRIGVTDEGRIVGADVEYLARAGNTADLTGPVITRSLTHTDNAYHFPAARFVGHACKTNTVSNTAFRGFGGPQGVITSEAMIDQIARELEMDPNRVRAINYYGPDTGETTPYGQPVEQNRLVEVTDLVLQSAQWQHRRAEIDAHNATDPVIRRGLAMMPVKFGISFNLPSLNQAGALVHVYQDGSVHLNHGGTEMGQGLFVKVAQVVAEVFQLDIEAVKITATHTGKVPNTAPTAASTGSDLNGMAAFKAATAIRDRMTPVAARHFDVPQDEIVFREGRVHAGNRSISFAELARMSWAERVSLSEAGHYATPKIHWDRASGKGRPFYYYAYGAACSEVSVDTLTGEYRVERTDILHDVGRSLNPIIDKGQVEGAFIQGMGWLTTEELWWDDKGRLRTHAPSTYKIPLASDRPKVFNVALADWSVNAERTIKRSKAVGEPPFMLGISVFEAIGHAVASVAGYRIAPRLDAPATPERVLMAVARLRGAA